jgi:hypothetical protein
LLPLTWVERWHEVDPPLYLTGVQPSDRFRVFCGTAQDIWQLSTLARKPRRTKTHPVVPKTIGTQKL